MLAFFKLGGEDGTRAVPCRDAAEWVAWWVDREARGVSHTLAEDTLGEVTVSTIFLGVTDARRPLPFETAVFGGMFSGERWPTALWRQALTKHAWALARVQRFDPDHTKGDV